MKRILFLDLENTIIDTWDTCNLASNHEVIKNWIKENNFDEVHVFSYAIWNEDDVNTFDRPEFRGWLESVFEIKFNDNILTIDKMIKLCNNNLRIIMDRDDFFAFMKKDIAFRLICEQLFHECDCFLLDDMVKNTSLFIGNHLINTIDVKGLE